MAWAKWNPLSTGGLEAKSTLFSSAYRIHKWKMFHCYVQCWRLSFLSRWDYKNTTLQARTVPGFEDWKWNRIIYQSHGKATFDKKMRWYVMMIGTTWTQGTVSRWNPMSVWLKKKRHPDQLLPYQSFYSLSCSSLSSSLPSQAPPCTTLGHLDLPTPDTNPPDLGLWRLIPESLLEPGWVL